MVFVRNVGKKSMVMKTMKRSKLSKACDISPKVRKEVMERDGFQCVICDGNDCLQVAHYISRARGGLGIPQNLAVLCIRCHISFDNGKEHIEIKNRLKKHFSALYDDWNEKKLIYSKWGCP